MAKRRFYRPPPPLSDLPRIVWSEVRNKAIAEFGKDNDPEHPNQFLTENEETASILLKLGYREVSLDTEAPPYIPEITPKDVGDVKIKPEGFTESHEAAKIKRESLLKKEEEPEIAPVPQKKTAAKPSVKKALATKKKGPSSKTASVKPNSARSIKRRVKK